MHGMTSILSHDPYRPCNAADRVSVQCLLRRLLLVFASVLYASALHYAYVSYLHPVWEYMGFTYRPLGVVEFGLLYTFVVCGACVVPTRLYSASSVVLIALYVLVLLPTIVVTFCLNTPRAEVHLLLLAALLVAFVIASMIVRAGVAQSRVPRRTPSRALVVGFVLIWLAMTLYLVAAYQDVMAFVTWYDVYDQRAAGASTNALMAYTQTYYAFVVSPALLAFGFLLKRPMLIVAGIAGCVIMYMINAQKTLILLPILMTVVWVITSSRKTFLAYVATALILLAGLVTFSVSRHQDDLVAAGLSIFLVHRTIAIPGLTLTQYHEVFGHLGYTAWAHVKGVGAFVSPPDPLAGEVLWPGLGYIVGSRMTGDPTHNMNANLFVADGLAAAGVAGILIVGVALGVFLRALDSASRAWDNRFILLICTPMAIALTNGQLSTVLLSFGGLFWLIFFLVTGSRLQTETRASILPRNALDSRR